MKILHVASFVGNVGDNASHIGFSNILDHFFETYSIEKIEIRRFYKNYRSSDRRKFDLEFINYANDFDLLVIGGGGFLDYWIEGSDTGTTIDIDPVLIEKIKTPTFICSVGCMPHKSIPDGNIDKFKRFLNAVNSNDKVKIAVRNDGSVNSLLNDIGEEYLENIPEILDNGFFYENENNNPLPLKGKYVSINITCDQLEMLSQCRKTIDKKNYLKALSKAILYIIDKYDFHVVFIPHITSDLVAISELLEYFDDFFIRNNITIAPCLQYDKGADFLFSIYKNSELVIGTRFHTNVCSLSMGVPTLGLIALDRVKYIYDSLIKKKQYVLLDYDFSNDLIHKIDTLLDSDFKNHNVMKNISEGKADSKDVYKKVFSEFGLI